MYFCSHELLNRKPHCFMGIDNARPTSPDSFFGNKVDYFLFSAKSKESIFDFAYMLSDWCNCCFSLMPTMKVAESKQCPMSPEFRLMHAQYEANGPESCYTADPVDRLNIIIFQNKAVSFDKSQSALAKTDHRGAFAFIDEGCDCHAFSPQGVRIGKCTPAEFAEFYLLIFAKKHRNADKLASHLAEFPQCKLKDLTQTLYNETPSTKTLSRFFRAVLTFSEIQIRQIMRKSESYFIGSIPQSMRPPVDLSRLFNNIPISKNEISINNL